MKISYLTMLGQKLFTIHIGSLYINFDNYQPEKSVGGYALYKRGIYVARVGVDDVAKFEKALKKAVERKLGQAA